MEGREEQRKEEHGKRIMEWGFLLPGMGKHWLNDKHMMRLRIGAIQRTEP